MGTDADLSSRRRIFDIPEGLSLRDLVHMTRHYGENVDDLVNAQLASVAARVTPAQRQDLRDLLILLAAVRRDKARELVNIVQRVQQLRQRLPPGTFDECFLMMQMQDTQSRAAGWILDDGFLDIVQPPVWYRQSLPAVIDLEGDEDILD